MPDELKPDRVRRSFRRWMIHVPDLDAELREALWTDPDALIETGSELKVGRRSIVAQVEGGATLKAYRLMDPLHTVVHFVMRSRARWSWVNGRRLLEAGLPTARPLGCCEDRVGPLRGRSFFLYEHVAGQNLLALAHQDQLDDARLDTVAQGVGRIWAKLGQLRLCHGDLKASNLVVDDQDHVWLLDLDGLRHPATRPGFRREREKDRQRFLQNWKELPRYDAALRGCVAGD